MFSGWGCRGFEINLRLQVDAARDVPVFNKILRTCLWEGTYTISDYDRSLSATFRGLGLEQCEMLIGAHMKRNSLTIQLTIGITLRLHVFDWFGTWPLKGLTRTTSGAPGTSLLGTYIRLTAHLPVKAEVTLLLPCSSTCGFDVGNFQTIQE